MGNVTFTLPYVWEINGDQITCTALPYPEKDFTGRYPQGYHPLFVSTDKNRIWDVKLTIPVWPVLS